LNRYFESEDDLVETMDTVATLFAPLFFRLALHRDKGDPKKMMIGAFANLCVRCEENGISAEQLIEFIYLIYRAKEGMDERIFNTSD
jgi:hypothetical protein